MTTESKAGPGLPREQIVRAIAAELDRAYDKHGREPWGRHEFYAIMKEEVDEVWDAIKRDVHLSELDKEIVQVAAVCIRFLETGERYGFVGKESR